MKLVILAQNAFSAGISTQAISLLDVLNQERSSNLFVEFHIPRIDKYNAYFNANTINLKVVTHPYSNSVIGFLSRLINESIIIPMKLLFSQSCDAVLIFANYYLWPTSGKKIVIIRHPYLLDHEAYYKLKPSIYKVTQWIRRFFLKITLLTTDVVILQSAYMLSLFQKQYRGKFKIIVLSNPISSKLRTISNKVLPFQERRNVFVYPSRYYKHKNHWFIHNLVKQNIDLLKSRGIQILVTLERDFKNKELMILIEKMSDFDEVIINVGEIDQTNLKHIYMTSKGLFFPSESETFGNALIESMYYSLPIIVPDKPYSRIICGNNAAYYEVNDIDSALDKIIELSESEIIWNRFSALSKNKSNDYFSASQWLERITDLI